MIINCLFMKTFFLAVWVTYPLPILHTFKIWVPVQAGMYEPMSYNVTQCQTAAMEFWFMKSLIILDDGIRI